MYELAKIWNNFCPISPIILDITGAINSNLIPMKTRLLITLFVLLSFGLVNAQTGNPKTAKLKGTVTDVEGFPIKKAYVFIDSLKTGIRTNKSGAYKLRVPVKTDLISIYAEEFGIQTVVYNGEAEVDFTFPKNRKVLTETQLSNLGYTIDPDIFRNIGKKSYSQYANIFLIIKEKFSGVRIDGNTIYVRGVISLDHNQTPLFVVDGNYVNSIGYINPDELKSIELLKGEEAALYGARGAPGVFIITLK